MFADVSRSPVEMFFVDSDGISMRLLQRFYRFEVGVVIFAGKKQDALLAINEQFCEVNTFRSRTDQKVFIV